MEQKTQSQMDRQRELAKIAQEKNNRAAELFAKSLNEEMFPDDRISDQWWYLARQAIMKTTPLSQRISLAEFAKAVEAAGMSLKDGISLFQFGVLSNSVEAVSPEQLHLSPHQYTVFIKECVDNIEWYGQRIRKLREEVEIAIANEFQMKEAADPKKNGLRAEA